jgi:hypothetical protein
VFHSATLLRVEGGETFPRGCQGHEPTMIAEFDDAGLRFSFAPELRAVSTARGPIELAQSDRVRQNLDKHFWIFWLFEQCAAVCFLRVTVFSTSGVWRLNSGSWTAETACRTRETEIREAEYCRAGFLKMGRRRVSDRLVILTAPTFSSYHIAPFPA